MGRPKGSRNEKTVEQVELPRCPDCQCTDSTVLSTVPQDYSGTTEDGERINWDGKGRPFNQVVRRRRKCTHCGKVWIVRTLEFVPPQPGDDDAGGQPREQGERSTSP